MNRPLSDAPPDDADLAAAIDASFGEGPPPPPLDGLLLAGRRARRRRTTTRAAVGGAVAAGVLAAAVASTSDWDLVGASGSDTGVATTPSTTPSGVLTPAQEAAVERLRGDVAKLLTDTGEVDPSRLPDAVVTTQLDSPTQVSRGGRSHAVVVQRDEVEVWCLLEWYRTGTLTSCEPASAGAAAQDKTFEEYVARMARSIATVVADEPDELITLEDGLVVGAPGTEILEQREGIDLGPRFAAPGDRTAAVEVLDGTGRRWYLLARQEPGGPVDIVPVDPRDSRPDFDAFLDEAAETYAGGPTEGFR